MRSRIIVLLAVLILPLLACRSEEDIALAGTSKQVFGTIPAAARAGDTPELVKLGRHLYTSNELSVNGKQSCNTCHPIEGPGADGKPTSEGALGTKGRRNTPTTLNAALHVAQFWDGRAATLEEQAAGPMMNPVEMAMPDEATVNDRLRRSPHIDRELFRAAYPHEADPLTVDHAARAIAAFERTLVTHDRFDEFMSGDARALSADEKEGLRRFMALGCTTCHNGPLVGARLYQRMGLIHPWTNTSDHGRFELTKNPDDDFVFKVPSLRNVARTGPYFHDGSGASLQVAVERMAWHQLGMEIAAKDRDLIVAFLQSLSAK